MWLFPDEGYSGVVIEIGAGMEKVERIGDTGIRAQAGVSLSSLAAFAAREGLAGLEFAGGIPGTLGGAVTMNAGAYGGEMKDVIVSAKVMDEDGGVKVLSCDELELGYRTSIVQKKQLIVLEAEFSLQPGETEAIQSSMKELKCKTKRKTAVGNIRVPGSTFKRPEGYFAGKLIEDAGLRGYRVGDAQVSEKHCGFVVNRGKATCAEVLQLIEEVQKKVKEQFGVQLEPEVRIIR